MTRERRLAIQMWEEVKERLPEWYLYDKYSLALVLQTYKRQFCADHGLNWAYNCWFCQYIRPGCKRCPLQSCVYNRYDPITAWARIVDINSILITRLEACDEIIAALKGGQ